MHEIIYLLKELHWRWLVVLVVAAVGLICIACLQPTAHAQAPSGDCWGGALSAEPVHCYVIEHAEAEGVLEVEGLYDDDGGTLYIFFNYLKEFDSWLFRELGQYFFVKGSEFVKRWPDQATYVQDYTLWSSRMAPQSIPYNVIILRTGGAEARLQTGGWASWTQVWPKVSDRTVEYVPDSFDVSEVDVTSFPELDCVEQQRLILRITSCDMSRRYPELGIAGWHGEGSAEFVQVKAPPGEEANIDAAREEFGRRMGVEISEGLVIIPVKYDFEELWRWAVVLNRFAVSAGNTIGINGAKVTPNIGTSGTLFPLDNLRPTIHEGSDQTRETIRVWGVDEQRIAESLPVLLPQLGIPIDAVGMIRRYRNEPPQVAELHPIGVPSWIDPAPSDVVGSMSGATQNDEEEGAGEAELSVPSSNVTLNDVSNDSPMSFDGVTQTAGEEAARSSEAATDFTESSPSAGTLAVGIVIGAGMVLIIAALLYRGVVMRRRSLA